MNDLQAERSRVDAVGQHKGQGGLNVVAQVDGIDSDFSSQQSTGEGEFAFEPTGPAMSLDLAQLLDIDEQISQTLCQKLTEDHSSLVEIVTCSRYCFSSARVSPFHTVSGVS